MQIDAASSACPARLSPPGSVGTIGGGVQHVRGLLSIMPRGVSGRPRSSCPDGLSGHDRAKMPAVIGSTAMGRTAKAEKTFRIRVGAEPEVRVSADAGAVQPPTDIAR